MNTRALADAALPTRSLGRAREIPPTVRRRFELRSLTALGFKPSAVTNLLVSPPVVGTSSDEPLRVTHGLSEDAYCSASDPRFRSERGHQHPITAGMDSSHLVPWKYAPSSVTQILTLPIVSMDVVSPSGTWRNASSSQSGQTFFGITPCPGVEPGTRRRGWHSRPVGSPFPRHGTLSRQGFEPRSCAPDAQIVVRWTIGSRDCRAFGS